MTGYVKPPIIQVEGLSASLLRQPSARSGLVEPAGKNPTEDLNLVLDHDLLHSRISEVAR